jgi:NADH-quinone oxidoreductase subunit E
MKTKTSKGSRRRPSTPRDRKKDLPAILAGFKGEEGDLIPILQQVQGKFGYISPKAIDHISHFLKISENQIFGVASFYSQFRFIEPGRNSIKVCMGTACHVRGGKVIGEAVEREIGISAGQTTEDKRFDLQRVACLGCCALAPVVQINDDIHSRMAVVKLKKILEKYA